MEEKVLTILTEEYLMSKIYIIWECQLQPDRMECTMCEVELLLNEKLLSLYQTHKPFVYRQNEEDDNLPMAAEDLKKI